MKIDISHCPLLLYSEMVLAGRNKRKAIFSYKRRAGCSLEQAKRVVYGCLSDEEKKRPFV